MKKFLLSAMALVAAMSVNAQVFKVSAEANGIGSDAVDVAAGKAWGSIEGAIEVSNPFATQHNSTRLSSMATRLKPKMVSRVRITPRMLTVVTQQLPSRRLLVVL